MREAQSRRWELILDKARFAGTARLGKGEKAMTSKECLQRALECAQLAESSPDAISRDTYAAMAKTWIELSEAERVQALIEESRIASAN